MGTAPGTDIVTSGSAATSCWRISSVPWYIRLTRTAREDHGDQWAIVRYLHRSGRIAIRRVSQRLLPATIRRVSFRECRKSKKRDARPGEEWLTVGTSSMQRGTIPANRFLLAGASSERSEYWKRPRYRNISGMMQNRQQLVQTTNKSPKVGLWKGFQSQLQFRAEWLTSISDRRPSISSWPINCLAEADLRIPFPNVNCRGGARYGKVVGQAQDLCG